MAHVCSLFRLPLIIIITGCSTILTAGVPLNASAAFTLINACPYTIWPVIWTISGSLEPSTTGFTLQPGESNTVQASSYWYGRFWARTHCTQRESTGNFSCVTGDCGSGKVECPGGPVTQPVTMAELSLNYVGGIDFYFVSLIKGFNLPMVVVPLNHTGKSVTNCTTAGCRTDLNRACPHELQMTDGRGNISGCRSACDVFAEDRYCCSGAYFTRDACKPSSYSEAFKNACPRAYTYPFDNASSLLYTCAGGSHYVVKFCLANTR